MLQQMETTLPTETNRYQLEVARHGADIQKMKDVVGILGSMTHCGLMAAADVLKGGLYQPGEGHINSFIHQRAQSAWRSLLTDSEMNKLLCARTKKELAKQINDDCPPFTLETIEATLGDMMKDAYKHFAFGLVDALSNLDYRRFKTNTPFKLGEKIIITGAFGATHWAYDRQAHILDLERCLNVIEGLDSVTKEEESVIGVARANGWGWCSSSAGTGETHHFTFKWFKNGNAHLVFKNKDTLRKANHVISDHFNGRAIPSAL